MYSIAWYDNIPVLSYPARGQVPPLPGWRISIRYPVVELLTGALFFLAVYLHGLSLPALKLCIFSAILIELSVSDLETLIVPDEFTLGGAAIGFVSSFFVPMYPGRHHRGDWVPCGTRPRFPSLSPWPGRS